MENSSKKADQSEIAGRYYGDENQKKDDVAEGLKETHDQVNSYYEDAEPDREDSGR